MKQLADRPGADAAAWYEKNMTSEDLYSNVEVWLRMAMTQMPTCLIGIWKAARTQAVSKLIPSIIDSESPFVDAIFSHSIMACSRFEVRRCCFVVSAKALQRCFVGFMRMSKASADGIP